MTTAKDSLQNRLIQKFINVGTAVNIGCMNGQHFKGVLRGFDTYSIALEDELRKTKLIYKHAISSISPQGDVDVETMIKRAKPKEVRG
jgi:host factor-I protein